MKLNNFIGLYTLGLLFCTFSLAAQNLIVNPSFEEYSVPCEDVVGQGRVYHALGWERATRDFFGASDLMSPCSIDGYQTPQNLGGYQIPKVGSNYAFFGFRLDWINPWNRSLGIESVQPSFEKDLVPFECYIVEFDLSLADFTMTPFDFGVDLYFSHDDFTMLMNSNPGITPQYGWSNMDTLSKTEWRRLSQEVMFSNTMRYLTIGWFSSPWNYPDETYQLGGFYIDNVVLYPCSAQTFMADAGEDRVACISDSVTLSTPYRNNEYSYAWINTFGDTLSTSTALSVEVTENTEYYLSQWDFRFVETWDTVQVRIEGCPELTLPNVFTPNSDHENDLWFPITKEIDEIEVSIYSRWGQSVFQYSGPASSFLGWDGGNAPEGTYYIVVKARNQLGRTLEENGTLTLLRN